MPSLIDSIGKSPSGVDIIVPAGTHSETGQLAASAVSCGLNWTARQKLHNRLSVSATVSE